MLLKKLKQKVIETSGTWRWALSRKYGTLVLMYHSLREAGSKIEYPYSVNVDRFKNHINMLEEFGRYVGPQNIVEGNLKNSKELNVLVTFDDGYRNVLDLAVPILESRNIPAIVFVTTEWTAADRDSTMSWSDLRELNSIEQMTIGSHCCNHYNLLTLTHNDARAEIIESKKTLEDKLGSEVNYFSYPSGGSSKELEEIVRKSGYSAAFRDRPSQTYNRYGIGRVAVGVHNQSLKKFASTIAVSPLFY